MLGGDNDTVGIANAIVGSFFQLGLALLVTVPIGVTTGTYLSEAHQQNRYAAIVCFVNDVLLASPSILIGLFVYGLVVNPFGCFSGWGGSIALGLVMLPIITRTTEDMLRLVPTSLKEAAFALGAPRYKVIAPILWRAARSGIMTGVFLAVARAAGESAPLVFTSVGSPFWTFSMSEPMASLPLLIYQCASSPIPEFVTLGWVGAFVITITLLVLSVVSEVFFSNRHI